MGIGHAVHGRMPRSLLVAHAAALLGVSRRTIYYRIRDGKLRTVRTPGGSQRVLMESIEMWLEQQPIDRGAVVSDTNPSAKFQGP
jgi:excisionase family DNA binding protein